MVDDNYEVGYGKPPKETRFTKGLSGNPKGRPKGTRNFKTDLEEELHEQVRITEGGKSEEVSKQRAIMKRTFEKALMGDMRAVAMIAQWVVQHLSMADEVIDTEGLNQDDKAIIERALNSKNGSDSSNLPDNDKLNITKTEEEKS
jgi:hypothetical protein